MAGDDKNQEIKDLTKILPSYNVDMRTDERYTALNKVYIVGISKAKVSKIYEKFSVGATLSFSEKRGIVLKNRCAQENLPF